MILADVIVVGAGIAGASAAAELAGDGQVIVLEMEAQPGYHATGRSAAFFAAAYGHPTVRGITACCERFFREPPDDFGPSSLIRDRDCMFFGREDQAGLLGAMHAEYPGLELLDAAAVLERVPVFAPGYLHGALREGRGGDLDVDALLQGYLRRLRRRGGALYSSQPAQSLRRRGSVWRVSTGVETFEAPVLVNAAGAWADTVAARAGLPALGLQPLRRTAFTVDAPPGMSIADWPEMVDVAEDFYFKPEAGRILVSPADETPLEPCDARPEEFDVAVGVDRFETATGLDIRRVHRPWAGLRTFAPDRLFVVGFDPRAEGFFWLAGQGGYGIQSAPALARLARWLVSGATLPDAYSILSRYAGQLAPARLIAGSQQAR